VNRSIRRHDAERIAADVTEEQGLFITRRGIDERVHRARVGTAFAVLRRASGHDVVRSVRQIDRDSQGSRHDLRKQFTVRRQGAVESSSDRLAGHAQHPSQMLLDNRVAVLDHDDLVAVIDQLADQPNR